MTEKAGFFSHDSSEAVQALEEHVLVKKRLGGGPEGLEIVHAEPDQRIGDGIRRIKARITAGDMAAGETSVDCAFDADTPASTLLEFAVAAVTALTGPPRSGEWQWTVRAKGLVPR